MASFLFSAASLLGLSENATPSRKHVSGITVALAFLAYAAIVAGADPPVVQLGRTSIIGTVIDDDLDYFAGIPYAHPPVGRLRFKAPVLMPSLNVDTFDATKVGPAPMQPGRDRELMSEDCLTINILRPAGLSHSNLPVMVFVYGGGNVQGSIDTYDGDNIVRQSKKRRTPIIYVTLNFRLNFFGFLVGKEAKDNGALNLGLRDIQVALQWVQKNIRIFGGDPSKVTLAGQSSGGINVADMAVNKKLHKLARALVLWSCCPGATPTFEPERNQKTFDALVAAIPECATSPKPFQCLQTADANVMADAVWDVLGETPGQYPFTPVLDDGTVPVLPSKSNYHNLDGITTMFGNCADEGFDDAQEDGFSEFFTALYSPPSDGSNLTSVIDQMEKVYPDDPSLGSPYGTGNKTFGHSKEFKKIASALGDAIFWAPCQYLREKLAQIGKPSFGYIFDDDGARPPEGGPVHHGADLPYNYGYSGGDEKTTHLAEQMRDYFLSFVDSLDPNDGKGTLRPRWEPYTKDNPVLMRLNSKHLGVIPDNIRRKQIKFLNEHASTFSR